MSYLDMYRQRIFAKGETEKDRIENNLAKDFSSLVKKSPNRVSIDYLDNSYKCILASGNSRVGTQTERKVVQYLMTDKSLKLPEGATFKTSNLDDNEEQFWLVLHREIHPYYGYFKYKVIELDYRIKYIDKNGVLKEVPVYINGTGEFDIKEFFRYTNEVVTKLPNRTLNLILAANKDFTDGLRLIIGDEAWRYVDSDKISIPGVYYTTVYKTTVDNSSDSIEERVADVDTLNSATIISNYGNTSVTIGLGKDDLKFSYIKDGKIQNGSMMFDVKDKEIISFKNGKLIPINEGATSVIVTDKITGFSKTFNIEVLPSIENYFYTIGNTKLSIRDKCVWEVNTDETFSISYDKDMLIIDKVDGKLKITALNKIGKTTIQFLLEDGQKIEKEIDIVSLWV